MGHGLLKAAQLSLGTCGQAARILGLHKKRWCDLGTDSDALLLEEEKRLWWAIILMDRFINLCCGAALFVTDDPDRLDPLPAEDLVWSEERNQADIESAIRSAPRLDTPFNIRVGQMAREAQIANLLGHVVRHIFDPIPDSSFGREQAVQLERTLKSYLPLLADEELRVGKYCGAYGMCNR
jgi:hypothetical protein